MYVHQNFYITPEHSPYRKIGSMFIDMTSYVTCIRMQIFSYHTYAHTYALSRMHIRM